MLKRPLTEWVRNANQSGALIYASTLCSLILYHFFTFIIMYICLTGRVPMRRLVYRVQPLPQSMLPLVWDFGQLDTNVEEMYIKQMVRRYVSLK